MTYELKVERLFDAPPEVVFDTLVDPKAQPEIFADMVEGWSLLSFDIDLRVGGEWNNVFGRTDGSGEPDRMTSVFTEIDRPHRLSYTFTMFVSQWGRTIETTETITFDEQDGKTLMTIVQSGFETEEDRDAFASGTPEFMDAIQKAVAARMGMAEGSS